MMDVGPEARIFQKRIHSGKRRWHVFVSRRNTVQAPDVMIAPCSDDPRPLDYTWPARGGQSGCTGPCSAQWRGGEDGCSGADAVPTRIVVLHRIQAMTLPRS